MTAPAGADGKAAADVAPGRGTARAGAAASPPAAPARRRTTRKTARAPYWSICCTCAATFTSEAAETRHAAMGDDWRTRHRRYATVTEAKR